MDTYGVVVADSERDLPATLVSRLKKRNIDAEEVAGGRGAVAAIRRRPAFL